MGSPALEGAAPQASSAASTGTTAAADTAIAHVLAAERDARVAVAECAQQAERELQAGRERARLITARGADRVAAVQRSVERQLEEGLAVIAAQRAALAQAHANADADARRLAAAIETLADELTRATLAASAPADAESAR